MTIYAYLFEAKSIQSYILDSGKLRDLVGASDLVDALCGPPLAQALAACGLRVCEVPDAGRFDETAIADAVAFSRKAGGSFYAFSGSLTSIKRLAAFWPLVVQQYAPGLDFDQGRGEGDSAFDAFRNARGDPDDSSDKQRKPSNGLRQARSRALIELPQAGPLTLRSPRTGRPAIKVDTRKEEPEPLDARTARQRWAYDQDEGHLVKKLAPKGIRLTAANWPRNMDPSESDPGGKRDAFPFDGDDRYIAVIHADGNGLGQLLMHLEGYLKDGPTSDYLTIFSQLSNGIEKATQEAVQRAVKDHLVPADFKPDDLLPARPIVLGGDDLTIIVRADLALPFTRTFLAAFEEATRTPMDRLTAALEASGTSAGFEPPDRLTACAGIAYIKANQPFYLGAHLAEGITAAVKQKAKALDARTPPSSLGWHRVTTAMIDDYTDVLRRELTVGRGSERFRNTLGAYAIHAQDRGTLPVLNDLLELQRLMEAPDIARGPARQLLTLVGQSPGQARALFRRWYARMKDPANGKTERLEDYDRLMQGLIGGRPGDLPYCPLEKHDPDADCEGPLGDLHALMAVKNRVDPAIGAAGEEQS